MLKLFNTLTKKKELFKPIKEGEVSMYNCGPTVYSYAHIGNFSAYLMADLLRRYLEYLGYKVHQIKNITDVGHLTSDADEGEDKLEKAARSENKDPYEIARYYEQAYLEDEKKLGILDPLERPRATEHVEEMIELIKTLMEKGFAYETSDGIYFDVSKSKEYGKLSGNTLESLQLGKRIEINNEKKHPADFALWKKLVGDNKNHIMRWNSPWGEGFPGWHIECSAMSQKYLGNHIDIHTGGEDNIFPHHECEIAQSECANDETFVNYWLHKSFFNINDEKMSKSKGNVYTLAEIIEMGYHPLDFRFLMLGVHYRAKLNFSEKSLDDAKLSRNKIKEFAKYVRKAEFPEDLSNDTSTQIVGEVQTAFEEAMNDDLNASAAHAALFDLMKKVNSLRDEQKLSREGALQVWNYLQRMNQVFVFFEESELADEIIPEEIHALIQAREKARTERDYTKADMIRDQILQKGYTVKDSKEGVTVSKNI